MLKTFQNFFLQSFNVMYAIRVVKKYSSKKCASTNGNYYDQINNKTNLKVFEFFFLTKKLFIFTKYCTYKFSAKSVINGNCTTLNSTHNLLCMIVQCTLYNVHC